MDWLQQRRDIAERHAHRLKIVERAILIVVICGVVADLILLAHGKNGRPRSTMRTLAMTSDETGACRDYPMFAMRQPNGRWRSILWY
jgi:hypothetical protein